MNEPTARKLDPIAAALALFTAAALVTAGWLRFGPAHASSDRHPSPEPPQLGAPLPPLRLLDPTTSEPILLLGLRGKVVWIVFWSPDDPASRAFLDELAPIWKRLKGRSQFALAVVATSPPAPESAPPTQARLPVYLATPETRRAFGAEGRNLPLHILTDDDGRIGVIAHGAAPETLNSVAKQAERWLDAVEPFGSTRFAEK